MGKLSIILFSILSLLFSERGDLLSFEYKDSKDINSIQQQLDSQFGESLSPDALFVTPFTSCNSRITLSVF